jgi:hypothetical protein
LTAVECVAARSRSTTCAARVAHELCQDHVNGVNGGNGRMVQAAGSSTFSADSRGVATVRAPGTTDGLQSLGTGISPRHSENSCARWYARTSRGGLGSTHAAWWRRWTLLSTQPPATPGPRSVCCIASVSCQDEGPPQGTAALTLRALRGCTQPPAPPAESRVRGEAQLLLTQLPAVYAALGQKPTSHKRVIWEQTTYHGADCTAIAHSANIMRYT